MIKNPIKPFYDENSRILILGSFPSVKSREQGFYYGHTQNRFWKVVAYLFDEMVPESIDEKKLLLKKCRIALSDVVDSCDISGSSDSSIKNVVPTDLTEILEGAPIEKIFLNGKTAEKLYNKYIKHKISIETAVLPSTSPANAAWNFEKLVNEWGKIRTRPAIAIKDCDRAPGTLIVFAIKK